MTGNIQIRPKISVSDSKTSVFRTQPRQTSPPVSLNDVPQATICFFPPGTGLKAIRIGLKRYTTPLSAQILLAQLLHMRDIQGGVLPRQLWVIQATALTRVATNQRLEAHQGI